MRSKKSLPCLGGEVLLAVFGDFDVARELSVEAMMSIRSCSGAASLGGRARATGSIEYCKQR